MTWSARAVESRTTVKATDGMWSLIPTIKDSQVIGDSLTFQTLPPIDESPRRSARVSKKQDDQLQVLLSHSLYTPESTVIERTNWLERSSMSISQSSTPRQRGLTWSAPVKKLSNPSSVPKLWTPLSPLPLSQSNSSTLDIINEPWTRRLRPETSENEENFHMNGVDGSLWEAKRISTMAIEKNWLFHNVWWVR